MTDLFQILLPLAVLAAVVPLLGFAIYVVIVELVSESRIRKRAHRDYEAARGTQHLRLLRRSLKVLRRSLQARRSRLSALQEQLHALHGERWAELSVALSTHLVHTGLTEVRGVGPNLSERIVRHCFRGSLDDLRSARRIRGVGPSRHTAIMAWARAQQTMFPRLLRQDFPGKQRILDTYAPRETPLLITLGSEEEALTDEESIQARAQEAVSRLASIKRSRFRAALQGGRRAASVPEWYFAGVHAPWQEAPEWFSRLMAEYRS